VPCSPVHAAVLEPLGAGDAAAGDHPVDLARADRLAAGECGEAEVQADESDGGQEISFGYKRKMALLRMFFWISVVPPAMLEARCMR
jgi:hypothetical protein